MKKKLMYRVSGIILFVIGAFFLVNSQANITGAVIAAPIFSSSSGYILGLIFILISGILFMVGSLSIEDLVNELHKKIYEKKQKHRSNPKYQEGLKILKRQSNMMKKNTIKQKVNG